MHYISYIFCFIFLLRVGGVPSGFKIKNARYVVEDEYPFIVSLERQITIAFNGTIQAEENVHICTCVALTQIWMLTAGHCIDYTVPKRNISDNLQVKTVIRYGSQNTTYTADVLSTLLHPSSKDPELKNHNNIGLLRTVTIYLKQFVRISTLDINNLGGREVMLAGYKKMNLSRISVGGLIVRKPLELLSIEIVRHDTKDPTTLPGVCVARNCTSTAFTTCPDDSGGPMLHPTGVLGINSISLENMKLCSAVDKNSLIDMDVIIPVRLHAQWIADNVKAADKR